MTTAPKKSDLVTRTVTAIAMVAVSGIALWLGGMWWTVFVLAVGVGVWFEWSTLCLLMFPPGRARTVWRAGGAIYCGLACAVLLALRDLPGGAYPVLMIVGAVIGVDVGAYFFGRFIGGPKIAPAISPSKTWAGLVGGILGAGLALALGYFIHFLNYPTIVCDKSIIPGADPADCPTSISELAGIYIRGDLLGRVFGPLILGAFIAITAQAGDFFESWMKRRAGVKDSGNLLPGHGGLFDRVDGLLLVLAVLGFVIIAGGFPFGP